MDASDSYRRLIDRLPDGYAYHEVVVDAKGEPVDYVFIDVNPAFEELTGLRREQLIGKRVTEALPGIERSGFDWIGTYGHVARSGESATFEQYSENLGRWFDVTAYSDQPRHLTTVFHNITDRKRTEETLRVSERRYHSLLEHSMDAIYLSAPDGKVTYVNRAWLDLFGYEPEDIASLNAIDLYVNPADRDHFVRRMEEAGFVKDEVLYKKKDGTRFDCQRYQVTLKNESGAVVAYQGVLRDITERKQAEAALRESEEKYRSLFKLSRDAIYLVSPDGTFIEVNQAWLDILGCSPEDVAKFDAAHWYADPADRVCFRERMAVADDMLDDEVQLRRKDGTVFDCQRRNVVQRDEHGNVRAFQGVMRDVTELRNAERMLRTSEEEHRSLFEQSMDPILLVEIDGSNVRANQAWLDLFGYSRDELPDLNILDVYEDPTDRKDFLRRIARTGVIEDEVRFKKKDGTVFDCQRTVTVRRDDDGKVVRFQGIMRDITQQKHVRAELERLARFDPLTGLLNRRAIMEKLDEWISHVRRYKGRLSVAMLDIDHFKRVNDLHGHLTGDRVLAETAGLLQRNVRLTDFVGRYGGEEFLVILPRTDTAGAAIAAERIRVSLPGLPVLNNARGKPSRVTVSVGVAEWQDKDNEDTLVGRADAALYAAKKAGRNRVEVTPRVEQSD